MAHPRIDRLDDAIGERVERLVVAHHRRRLTRHGWARAFEPAGDELWCTGEPPPRDGNRLELLVDGEDALGRLEQDLLAARESVFLAGWHFDPGFHLSHGGPTLHELLAGLDVPVRVLAWAGAPLPLFKPSRAQVRRERDQLVEGTRIRMALDSKERPMHCHHEKLAVIDGRIAFVGGIDLTGLAGDRVDERGHPLRRGLGWHDAATRIEGPLVADVAEHLALRWLEVTGERVDVPHHEAPRGEVRAQFVRTVPNNVYDALPKGDFRILEAYVRAFRSARELIYIENQFLWAPELVEILVDKLRHPPTDEFRMLVLLPARPNNGNDDTRGQLGVLVDADRDDRLLACTLYQPRRNHQVYVHAKIGIVDDRWLCIGSANLNAHSLFNDTEACVITCDEKLAREARLSLWREHLDGEDVSFDRWRKHAEDPDFETLALLPHVSRRTRRFLGPLNGLLVDG